MKLLMTCDAVGGVWQYAHELARALADDGVEVVLAVLGPARNSCESGDQSPSGAPQSPARDLRERPSRAFAVAGVTTVWTGLPLDWLASGPDEVLAAGRAVAALAAEHRVDVVQLNSPALAGAGPFPAPVVAVAHGCSATWFDALGETPGRDHAWHGELMRAGLLAADATVAPSAAHAATLHRVYGLPERPVAVHNGRTPRPVTQVAPADHVLTAGRLWDRVKATDLLDAVAAALPIPFRAAGPTRAPHGETVEATHLRLLGTLSDDALAAEYGVRPIFVSAARFEPFGLAVLEAAQAGCPLVLSGIDTFRELWTGAALFVADETPETYAAAITRVRTEAGLRAHLSEAARQRAARYTPQATAAAMLTLYRSLRDEERVAA